MSRPFRLPRSGRCFALVAALSPACLVACAKPVAEQKAPPPQRVPTTVAREATLRPLASLPGLIAPFRNVAIQSSLTEPADSVSVEEGQHVSQGEVIAKLDTADLQAQLEADLAQANSDSASATHTAYQGTLTIAQGKQTVDSAIAAVRQAQETSRKDTLDLTRYAQLLSSGYVSQQQYAAQVALVRNDAQAERAAQATLASDRFTVTANGPDLQAPGLQSSSLEQARATQQMALAQAQQVRTSIAKATIVSPIDGVVVNRNLNAGEYPGTRQLFTLQQVDPIYAVLRGSSAQIAAIENGASAEISASDVVRAKLRGTVVGVLNQINPGSTDFQVKVLLHNPGGILRPGMAVLGNVALPTVRGISVPVTAFVDDTHGSVMIVGAGAIVRTAKVTQLAQDGKNAVVSGLGAGARVISDGQTSVGNGQKVAIRE
jgi:multidrug efflux pump subunit AcrA (membrane-fusion protein)